MIAKARDRMSSAGAVLEEKNDRGKGRSGTSCWLHYAEDCNTSAIGQRIADMVGLPLTNAESMQVIHRGVSQKYRLHFDAYNALG